MVGPPGSTLEGGMAALLDRRAFLAASGMATAAWGGTADAADGHEVIAVWPSRAPGIPTTPIRDVVIERSTTAAHDRAATSVAHPSLTVFRPAAPNGAAMLLLPGGAFKRVALDKEGVAVGQWLAARGVTAFVLRYRLPADGWREAALAPFQDAERAMRVIRHQAARFGIVPERLGVIGFSAGGLLAAALATGLPQRTYAGVDALDTLPTRPSVAALIYPVLDGTTWLPRDTPAAAAVAGPIARFAAPGMPPTFLCHSADDHVVPATGTVDLFRALLNLGVRTELHLFAEGGHGFGLTLPPSLGASAWVDLFARFAGPLLGSSSGVG